jgi:hypothetical protein
LVGVTRPNLNPTGEYWNYCANAWFINNARGALYGYGKCCDDSAGTYYKGDRVGVLLNLDDGSLRFFKNGVQHGPGYPAGSVTGPVVAAVQMGNLNESMRLLPDVELRRRRAGRRHETGQRRPYLGKPRPLFRPRLDQIFQDASSLALQLFLQTFIG